MHADRWTSVRTLIPPAWASLALLQSCAQVVPADAGDAGVSHPPEIVAVDPTRAAYVLLASRYETRAPPDPSAATFGSTWSPAIARSRLRPMVPAR